MPTLILAQDRFADGEAKTAEALLRYGRDPVVAVVDRKGGGQSADAVVGPAGEGIPIVASVEDGLELGPERLVIGVAPVGGRLPDAWRAGLEAALERGVDVVSGLHDALAADPELARAAQTGGAEIHDIRQPPPGKPIYSAEILELPCEIVLTVGTDCSSGKMTTSVELAQALRDRGVQAAFAATGQTGILIGADSGVVVDAVPADFIAGFTEQLVLEAYEATGADVVVVEGQGALSHPAYGGVSLGLLHGASPHACVLCHDATRTHKGATFHDGRQFPVLDPAEEWDLIAQAARPIREPDLVGLSVMDGPLPKQQRGPAFQDVPRVDVLDEGADRLAGMVEARL